MFLDMIAISSCYADTD